MAEGTEIGQGALSAADLTAQYKTLEARFDQAAKTYDACFGAPSGSRPGNALLCWLRAEHLDVVRGLVPPGAALLDIGCGTGEEALRLAQDGYSVLGIDVSPGMVWQAQAKLAGYGLGRGALFRVRPAGRLAELDERGPFEGAYASLGTLNTEPDLAGVARGLHDLLAPGAPFVATVMSCRCLFEALRGLRPGARAERLNRSCAWSESRAGASDVIAPVKFYTPGEFAAPFAEHFTVERVMAFPLWLPPVHLHALYRADGAQQTRLALERRTRTWPGLRAWGDHFLMVLRHRS
ncbi:MAG: methyltransferase domain-containing protein [Anaerolineae bacterium]|nr:methyltransferase domain-containing protein [Anaerolineae bacterium]